MCTNFGVRQCWKNCKYQLSSNCNNYLLHSLQTYLEAAKTKFTRNYKGMNPSKITTTVGLNIGKIDISGIRLNFWDLGGQTELQSLWDKVIINKYLCKYLTSNVFICSITLNVMLLFTLWIRRIESGYQIQKKHLVNNFICNHAKSWCHFFFSDRMIASENLVGIPLLVLANKQDIPDCMGVREVKPIFNKNAHLIGRRDCMVMPVSALTGYVSVRIMMQCLDIHES